MSYSNVMNCIFSIFGGVKTSTERRENSIHSANPKPNPFVYIYNDTTSEREFAEGEIEFREEHYIQNLGALVANIGFEEKFKICYEIVDKMDEFRHRHFYDIVKEDGETLGEGVDDSIRSLRAWLREKQATHEAPFQIGHTYLEDPSVFGIIPTHESKEYGMIYLNVNGERFPDCRVEHAGSLMEKALYEAIVRRLRMQLTVDESFIFDRHQEAYYELLRKEEIFCGCAATKSRIFPVLHFASDQYEEIIYE